MADLGYGFVVSLKDAFTATSKKVIRGQDAMSRGFKGITGRLKGLTAAVPGLAAFATAMGAAYVGIVQPIKKTIELAEETDRVFGLLSMGGKFDEARTSVDMLQKASRKLAVEYGTGAAQNMRDFYMVFSTKEFENVKDAPGFLEEIIRASKATRAETALLATATALYWKMYGEGAETATEISGKFYVATGKAATDTMDQVLTGFKQFAPIGQQLGISADELLGVFAAMTHRATSVEDAATQFKNLLIALEAPSPAVAGVYQSLELNMSKAAIQARGLKGTIDMLAEAGAASALKNTGITLEGLGLQFEAAAFQGDNLRVTSAHIAAAMDEASPKELADSMKLLGINVGGAEWEAMSLKEQFGSVESALQMNETGLSKFFPSIRSLSGALAILNSDGEEVGGWIGDIGKGGPVVEEALKSAMETPGERMKRMKSQLEEIQLTIGENLVPILMKLTKAMEKVNWDKFGSDMGYAFDAVGMILDDNRLALKWAGLAIEDFFGGIGPAADKGWKAAKTKTWDWATGTDAALRHAGTATENFFTETIPELASQGWSLAKATAWEWATSIDASLRHAGTSLAEFFTETVPRHAGMMWDSIMESATELPGRIGDYLKENLQPLFDALGLGDVGETMSGLWEGVKGAVMPPIEIIRAAVNSLSEAVNSLMFDYTLPLSDQSFGEMLGIARIPALASGGVVTGPTSAIVGEAGPEAVIPLSRLPEMVSRMRPVLASDSGGRGGVDLAPIAKAIERFGRKPVVIQVVLDGRQIYESSSSFAELEAGTY